MDHKEAKRWLRGIVRQRQRLVDNKLGKKNPVDCAKICERLNRLLSAYPYSGDKIFHFIDRNYIDIFFIIPGTDNINHQKLRQCIQISRHQRRNNECSTSIDAPLPTQ